MRAGVGISTLRDATEAADEAVAAALVGGLRPGAALAFAGPGHADRLDGLVAALAAGLHGVPLVGATTHGVLAAGQEFETTPSVVVVAIEGCDAAAFQVGDLAGHEAGAGAEIAAQLGGAPRAEDLIVLLPTPGAYDTSALVTSLRGPLEPAALVGAGAADPVGGAPALWSGSHVERAGVVGLAVRAEKAPRIGVTQACRLRGDWLTVTRTQGHWLLALDGRPALPAYVDAVPTPLASDLPRAAESVLVAVQRPNGADGGAGYLVRHVAGFAAAEGAFAIPELVAPGDRIAFAVREPEGAREDLVETLDGLAGGSPALVLYFDCCARGAGFFGVAGIEAAYLDRAFAPAPVAGMFGSCEIGPVGGVPELLTYTGVVAVLDG